MAEMILAGCRRAQSSAWCCCCCISLNNCNSLRATIFVHILMLTMHRSVNSVPRMIQIHLSACIDRVADWMSSNHLQWYAAKTKVLWSTTSRQLLQLLQSLLRVGANLLLPNAVVRNLGIFINADVLMRSHVMRMFRHSETTVPYPTISAANHSSVSDVTCFQSAGQWYCHAVWHFRPPSLTSSVGDERCCQNDLFNVVLKSHLTVPTSVALVESSWTNQLQVSRPGIQVPARYWSSLSGANQIGQSNEINFWAWRCRKLTQLTWTGH